MPASMLWAWDDANKLWVKLQVDATGHLILSDEDPFEIVQDTPEHLTHVRLMTWPLIPQKLTLNYPTLLKMLIIPSLPQLNIPL